MWHAFPPLSAARVWPSGFSSAVALGSICSARRYRLLFAGFTATMATSDFSQLYIIGFELPLLSFAAPHDSEAVERPPMSRRSASERAMVLGPRDAPFRLTNAASGCCLRLVSRARRIRDS